MRHPAFYVRGLKSIDFADLRDELDKLELEELKTYESASRLISICVFANGKKAFRSPEEVQGLRESEIDELIIQVVEGVCQGAPNYYLSDVEKWNLTLREGAEHFSNHREANSMYYACDRAGMEGTIVRRPERYFGLPTCELTDGHQMVFSAAIEAIELGLRSVDV